MTVWFLFFSRRGEVLMAKHNSSFQLRRGLESILNGLGPMSREFKIPGEMKRLTRTDVKYVMPQ